MAATTEPIVSIPAAVELVEAKRQARADAAQALRDADHDLHDAMRFARRCGVQTARIADAAGLSRSRGHTIVRNVQPA